MLNGNATVGGGALVTDSSPNITSCVFHNCSSNFTGAGFGGAVYVEGPRAAPRLRHCSFTNNYANMGAALYVKHGSVAVEQSRFTNNTAAPVLGQGGAVYLDRSQPTHFSDILIANCACVAGALAACWAVEAAAGHAAGPAALPHPTLLRLCLLPASLCHACCCALLPPRAGSTGFSGGAIATAVAGDVHLDRVSVLDNYSSSHAGAFLAWGTRFHVTDSLIAHVRRDCP